MTIIDFTKIYRASWVFKRSAMWFRILNNANIKDETLREYHRAQRRPLQPLQLGWSEGSSLVDYSGTTAVLPVVISGRFIDVLTESGATGWTTYPIELRGKNSELIEGYCALAVSGRCGPLQPKRSQIETRIGRTGKPYKVKIGYYFDEATWDGRDLFVPNDTAFVFVTEKVKCAIENAKLTNIAFTPLNGVEDVG